ncbi:hypothetical protein F2Q68_00020881 [Brassica cretica]|uniref:Uncharacterized protein n=1 Tax=Brassica cretica TaxID=69181 RepID=A0A8S9FYI4_BRACR|nr:hypothetical protein F2Q68_00020881 [Brassica cretica]
MSFWNIRRRTASQTNPKIAQTAESVKRQQGTLPGKTDKNPKECNAVELRSGKQLSEPVKKRFTAAEKGKQKESEQPPADTPAAEKEREPTVGTNLPGPEQPAEAVRSIPELVPAREYTPKVPYHVPAKATLRAEAEQSVMNIDADGYAKMLDSARSLEQVKEQRREFHEERCHFGISDAEQPVRPIRRLFPRRTSV